MGNTISSTSGAPESILQSAGVINPFADLVDAAKAQGQAYAKGEKAVYAVVDEAARALGTKPTYVQWVAYSEAWKQAYAGDDAQKAWERFAALLKSRCGLDKPKAEGKAKVVSAKRADEAKAVEALAAQPREVLAQQAKALIDEATPEALKQQALITKAIKAKAKADNEVAQAAFVALRKEVREAVSGLKWSASSTKVLQAIKGLLEKQ